MKTRAEKKVQIAIDKMIDLQDDYVNDTGIITRILDSLNELESRIMNGKTVNGRINI